MFRVFRAMTADPPNPIEVDPRNWTGDVEFDEPSERAWRAEQERRRLAAEARALRYPLRYGVLMLSSGLAMIVWVVAPWTPPLGDGPFEHGLNATVMLVAGLGLTVGGGLGLNAAWMRRSGRG